MRPGLTCPCLRSATIELGAGPRSIEEAAFPGPRDGRAVDPGTRR